MSQKFPPAPEAIKRKPSGPKSIQPPLWFTCGWLMIMIVKPLAESATFGSPETVYRRIVVFDALFV